MTDLADQSRSAAPEPLPPSASSPQGMAALFRTILGEASLPMAATTGESHVVQYANEAFCRLVGRGDAEVVEHPLPGVLGETELGDTVALLNRVYNTGGAASVTVFREGGAQPAMHATYAAWRVPAEHGRPAGLLVQVIDTSDQAQAAEELREVNKRLLQAGLDAEVRAETHAALNAALRETEARLHVAAEEQAELLAAVQVAHRQAEAALRVRDEFLGIAAHELRSPLTAIKGVAQLATRALERGPLDPEAASRYLGNIVASAARLEALLTDLLDVSRMRAEGLSARVGTMDLAALASAVARRVQDSTEGTVIVCDVPNEPVQVSGDRGRLEQVLDNLLSNAIKYSPKGGEIVLRLSRVPDGVVLTVQDRGIGLPAGEQERIFEPFRRASNSLAQNVPGIGLGLHISRQIAEAHGGTLRAESQGEGSGTTMTLWLPTPRA